MNTKLLLPLLAAMSLTAVLAAQTTQRPTTFNGDLKPFYHGVASGDPTPNSVIIWTRVTPEQSGSVDVDYKVATDLEFTNLVASGSATATSDADYTVKVDVTGLQSGSTYFYYFSALNANSLIGRAKTTPEGPVDHLRFGVVSCSNYEGGYFNAYGTLAERNDIDAVIHLGDYIYEYGAGVYGVNLPDRVNEPDTEIVNLPDYRTRYGLYRLDEDLIRLHQQHTVLSVWDDHESANDSYTDGAQNHQPDEGDWNDRKAISKQVYFEWMPVRDNAEKDVYRKLSYGNLCDLLMLDTRLEGRVQPPPHFDTPDDPVRTMISQTQMDWLIDNLKNSTATWKVLGNQVLFTDTNVGFAAGAFDGTPDPTNIDSIRAAEDLFIDNWESYPTQRNAIIDTLRDAEIDNVVIITGDSHSSWAFDVTKKPVQYPNPAFLYLPQANPYDTNTEEGYNPDTGEGSWAVEFGTPSISSPNFDESIGAALTEQFEAFMNQPIPGFNLEYNPHIKYIDLDRHGYFLLDLKPDTAQANFYYIPSQYIDSLAENFGAAAYTLQGENHLNISAQPSTGKAIQDIETPLLPFGTVSTGAAPENLALFGIYPNPATTELFLQFGLNEATELAIALYDQSGKRVQYEAPKRFVQGLYQYRMELGTLTPGMYVLTLEMPDGKVVSRQVVVR